LIDPLVHLVALADSIDIQETPPSESTSLTAVSQKMASMKQDDDPTKRRTVMRSWCREWVVEILTGSEEMNDALVDLGAELYPPLEVSKITPYYTVLWEVASRLLSVLMRVTEIQSTNMEERVILRVQGSKVQQTYLTTWCMHLRTLIKIFIY